MNKLDSIISEIEQMDMPEKIAAINEIKSKLKAVSPFHDNPVECVQWVKADEVIANDYNPNSVAPPGNGTAAHIHSRGWIYTANCCLAA